MAQRVDRVDPNTGKSLEFELVYTMVFDLDDGKGLESLIVAHSECCFRDRDHAVRRPEAVRRERIAHYPMVAFEGDKCSALLGIAIKKSDSFGVLAGRGAKRLAILIEDGAESDVG